MGNIYRLVDHNNRVVKQFNAENEDSAKNVAQTYYESFGIRCKAVLQTERLKLLVAMQHALTPEQLSEIEGCIKYDLPIEVIYLRDADPSLFNALSAMTGSENLESLASRLHKVINDGYIGAIMPIGSPAFMAEFITYGHLNYTNAPALVFAHSDRISSDNPDGTKTTKFIHRGWIGVGKGKALAFGLNNGKLII